VRKEFQFRWKNLDDGHCLMVGRYRTILRDSDIRNWIYMCFYYQRDHIFGENCFGDIVVGDATIDSHFSLKK
jgi:hypothetical protein